MCQSTPTTLTSPIQLAGPSGSHLPLSPTSREGNSFAEPPPPLRKQHSLDSQAFSVASGAPTSPTMRIRNEHSFEQESSLKAYKGERLSCADNPMPCEGEIGTVGAPDYTVKCFMPGQFIEGDSECVRISLNEVKTVQELIQEVLEGFELLLPELVKIKYKDEDSDFVTITKKTKMSEIHRHAVSLHVYTKDSEDLRKKVDQKEKECKDKPVMLNDEQTD